MKKRHLSIKILQVILQDFEPFLRRLLENTEDGAIIYDHHDAYILLYELIGVLNDLDHAYPDPLLQPGPSAKKERKGWRARQEDRALGELLRVTAIANRSTQETASAELARMLGKRGYRRAGEKLSAKQLIRIRYKNFQ